MTTGKSINVPYIDTTQGTVCKIPFSSETFNYMDLDKYLPTYDKINKVFVTDGYKYSPPSIGVEDDMTRFLASLQYRENGRKFEKARYDFIFFLGHKRNISFSEIENLVSLFNEELSIDEQDKISEIVYSFSDLSKYSLVHNGISIPMTSKVDLLAIWD